MSPVYSQKGNLLPTGQGSGILRLLEWLNGSFHSSTHSPAGLSDGLQKHLSCMLTHGTNNTLIRK